MKIKFKHFLGHDIELEEDSLLKIINKFEEEGYGELNINLKEIGLTLILFIPEINGFELILDDNNNWKKENQDMYISYLDEWEGLSEKYIYYSYKEQILDYIFNKYNKEIKNFPKLIKFIEKKNI